MTGSLDPALWKCPACKEPVKNCVCGLDDGDFDSWEDDDDRY